VEIIRQKNQVFTDIQHISIQPSIYLIAASKNRFEQGLKDQDFLNVDHPEKSFTFTNISR